MTQRRQASSPATEALPPGFEVAGLGPYREQETIHPPHLHLPYLDTRRGAIGYGLLMAICAASRLMVPLPARSEMREFAPPPPRCNLHQLHRRQAKRRRAVIAGRRHRRLPRARHGARRDGHRSRGRRTNLAPRRASDRRGCLTRPTAGCSPATDSTRLLSYSRRVRRAAASRCRLLSPTVMSSCARPGPPHDPRPRPTGSCSRRASR